MSDASTPVRRPTAARPRARLPLSVMLSLAAHAVALVVGLFVLVPVAPAGTAGAPQPIVAAFVEALEPVREDAEPIEDGVELEEEPRLLDEAVVVPAPEPLRDEPEVDCTLPEACDAPDVQRAPLTLPEIPLAAARSRPPPPPVVEAPPAPAPASRISARPARKAAPVRPRRARLSLTHRPDVRRYYPEAARRRGIEGTALVRIEVDTSGRVTLARVERSSGSSLLDRHALRFARDLRFAPGGGGAALQPVSFSLQ